MGIFKRKKKARPSTPSATGFDRDLRLALAKLRAEGWDLGSPGADHVVVRRDDGASSPILLVNLRAQWAECNPSARTQWLTDAIRGLLTTRPETGPEAIGFLRPAVRPRAMYENLHLVVQDQHRAAMPRPPTWPVGRSRVVSLVIDEPTTMTTVMPDHLESMGVTAHEAYEIAIANLGRDVAAGWQELVPGVFGPTRDDDYAASLLLLPGFVDQLPFDDPIVVNPNRRCVIAASASNIEVLPQLFNGARASFEQVANPISIEPLMFDGIAWKTASLPADHPAGPGLAMMLTSASQCDYDQQRSALMSVLGDEVHIGERLVGVDPGGQPITVAAWTEGVEALLPRAELISLVSEGVITEGGDPTMAPWDVVAAVVGPALEPTHHWPERWRVVTFPDAEQLAAITARATR